MRSSSLCQNHFLYNASYLIFIQQGIDLLNPNFSPRIDNLLLILISKSWESAKEKSDVQKRFLTFASQTISIDAYLNEYVYALLLWL